MLFSFEILQNRVAFRSQFKFFGSISLWFAVTADKTSIKVFQVDSSKSRKGEKITKWPALKRVFANIQGLIDGNWRSANKPLQYKTTMYPNRSLQIVIWHEISGGLFVESTKCNLLIAELNLHLPSVIPPQGVGFSSNMTRSYINAIIYVMKLCFIKKITAF